MWATILTIFKRRRNLRTAGLLALCVALITTLLFDVSSYAAPGINQRISFQGRLQYATGGVVADGFYNMQFKIYQDGTKTSGGTLEWTETYVNDNNDEGVEVKNGYFSVELGSNNPFGNQVDWNQDTLWLTMNVAGSSDNCTTFNNGACIADGEMNPRQRFTSTPYSLNSGALQGKTADNFIQLAQGLQEDASFNTSVAINKTGIGNFFELQNAGADVLTIEQDGDLIFGSETDHNIVVDQSANDTAGKNLNVQAGTGGNGDGANGGTLILQGGQAGGTNGSGGWVSINAGSGNGTGNDGTILVGEYTTGTINIGTLSEVRNQTINVGANNTAGSTTNVTVGSGGNATGGTTTVQSKDNTTIKTNGVDRATFDTSGNLILGNGVSNATPDDFRIQGTASSATGVSGGTLTIQGGGATTGNANGGNLVLKGGSAAGTGQEGMVVIDTPAYTMASTQSSASDVNITQSNIDGFGVVTLNATATNVDFTLGAPSLGASAAGRILYVTAANGSSNFMLHANVGGGAGVEQSIPMKQNTTATLIWSGSLWTVAGSASGGSLQSAYDNSVQSTGNAEIITANTASGDGFAIRQNSTSTTNTSILSVQSAGATPLFSVNSLKQYELATNPGAETAGLSANEFPENTWKNSDDFWDDPEDPWDSVVTRYTTAGNNIASGSASVKVEATNAAYTGARNQLNSTLTPGVEYNVSLKARSDSGTLSDFSIYYFPGGAHGEPWIWCTNTTVTSTAWTTINCSFTATSAANANNQIFITPNSETGVFYIDDLSISRANAISNVQIGGDTAATDSTFLTLGKNAGSPADGRDALLGSMYYDTTIGKVQCYEEDGWGNCGEAPDTFVTLTPEFSGAVMNGSSLGTMTSDICSDDLDINDATNGPQICDTNETYNFYNWTSAETSAQTKSVYVNYLLPSTFKEFVQGSTSLLGRRDASTANVSYQVYHSDNGNLTPCGSAVTVTSSNNVWQTGAATGTSDPFDCGATNFKAGDSIVIRINMSAEDDANAYVSNLRFIYSNN